MASGPGLPSQSPPRTGQSAWGENDDDDYSSEQDTSLASSEDKRQADRLRLMGEESRESGVARNFEKNPLPLTSWFTALTTISVLANMAAVGAETDYGCIGCPASERGQWVILDVFFTALFAGEILLRIMTPSPREYVLGAYVENSAANRLQLLNIVDAIVVGMRVVYLFQALSGGTGGTFLKLISMVRVYQIRHAFRHLPQWAVFMELALIGKGISDAMQFVVLIFTLLAFLMWTLSIILTITIGHDGDIDQVHYPDFWQAHDYWGTVPRSMMTLLQVLTLDSWSSAIMRPLIAGPFKGVLVPIFLFLCLGWLSMLNILVGAIVGRTMAATSVVRSEAEAEAERIVTRVVGSLRGVFIEADEDKSGELDRDELGKMLDQEFVKDRLSILQLGVDDLHQLFTLLDTDKSGGIPIDAFFRGAARLRGPALSLDLHLYSTDVLRSAAHCQEIGDTIGDVNSSLRWLLDSIQNVDHEIVKSDADLKDPVIMNRRARGKKQPPRNHLVSAADQWISNMRKGSQESTKSQVASQGNEIVLHGSATGGANCRASLMNAADNGQKDTMYKAGNEHMNADTQSTRRRGVGRTLELS
eukprot:TRINITY_DN10000_c0_g1_i1.p1 TRINITY_DN10000_c0_g1~~TRINITY_DN10000_c0_g1_i1.p1  ORF type:complete len:588 (+),score=100.08 TRINITY_DN10000_c0_g1_i1:113-1876(+)